MLTTLLRPESFPIVPYEDDTPLLQDHEALCRRADELGFVYLRRLLPATVVDPVRAFVRRYCLTNAWIHPTDDNPPVVLAAPGASLGGRGWDDSRFVELQRQMRLDPSFRTLGDDPRILDVLQTLTGSPVWMATANMCWIKFPGSPAQTTRPHQDIYFLPTCASMWTVWVPLVDTPMEVGPLGVVPGSHRKVWPHVDAMTGIDVPSDVCWATGPVEAGDVVVFNVRTVHCAWSNVSPTLVRLSLDIRYEHKPDAGTTILRPVS